MTLITFLNLVCAFFCTFMAMWLMDRRMPLGAAVNTLAASLNFLIFFVNL